MYSMFGSRSSALNIAAAKRVPRVHPARADIEQAAGLVLQKVQRHLDRVFHVHKIAPEFAVLIFRVARF